MAKIELYIVGGLKRDFEVQEAGKEMKTFRFENPETGLVGWCPVFNNMQAAIASSEGRFPVLSMQVDDGRKIEDPFNRGNGKRIILPGGK